MGVCERRLEQLKEVLRKEVELFRAFRQWENELQGVILDREWKKVTPLLKSLNGLAKEIDRVEEQRERVYQELRSLFNMGKEESFMDFCFRFPPEVRQEFYGLYRELRQEVVAVQGIADGIDAYCASTLTTLGRFMDALIPGSRHAVYSSRGTKNPLPHPMLVNQSL